MRESIVEMPICFSNLDVSMVFEAVIMLTLVTKADVIAENPPSSQ